jgi:hypothetical protein
VSTYHDIFQHGHPVKKLHVLKGPGNAEFSHLVRSQAIQLVTVEVYDAVVSGIKAGDKVKQGGFAGTVGTYNTFYLTPTDLKTNLADSMNAPERLGNIFCF